MQTIDNILLRNFKCYKHQSFNLSQLSVFCGNNSVGKSTAIQSLLLALQGNFSLQNLPLKGELTFLGTYSDIHKRGEEEDTVYFKISSKDGFCTWGYDLDDDVDSEYRQDSNYGNSKLALEELPLPMFKSGGDQCQSILANIENNFQYLSAERLGPKSYYPYSSMRRSFNWLGVRGEYTAQVLSNISGLGDLTKLDPRTHTNARIKSILHNIYEWMGDISPGLYIDAKSITNADIATTIFEFNGERYRPINVGFGLSYALPLVVALLITKPGGLVIIENPEAHLHPKGQSYLGRLIALSALAGVQVIIETHSDHVINGIRVAMRLTDDVPENLAKVFFVTANNQESIVHDLLVSPDGELPYWPEGFFDQQALDVRTIIKGEIVTEIPRRKSRFE